MADSDSNFLRKYVSLFQGTEVPDRFATWAGISCLSAMLERRIWIDMNIFVIYPNMFIVFVADSGRMRKSTAILMTSRLLAQTDPGPRMIAQKITPEALIDSLRITRSDEEGKLLKETCGGIVIADELASFINQDTYQRGLGSLMIQLWDCPDKYEYRTRGRPVEEIHFGHLSLLGGTTVHTLKDAIPLQAMGDGFSSRVLFVYEDQTPKPVPRPTKFAGFKQIEGELIQKLQKLSTLQGEVKLSPSAISLFDEEYKRFYQSRFYDDVQFQAYASRRDKHLLKVAMCLMAAEGDSLELTRHHIQGAIVLIADLESHMGAVFDRITMTEMGSMTEKIFRSIESNSGIMTRADILKKYSHQITAHELSKVTDTLCQAQRVKVDTVSGRVAYRVVKET